MHSMRRCSENGDGIRLLWFLAAACCLFLAGEGRVHLATPARVHHFKLTKAVETASLGLAGDGSRRRAETLMYRGEAKPWDEVGMHSDEVPDWMNGVNARARQLEAAAAAEREGLPRMGGLGLRLRDDWKVTGMIRGGAAAMLKETCPVCSSGAVAGVDADECRCIRKGDVLMEVDGVSVQGLDVQEASVILVGPNRSEVCS